MCLIQFKTCIFLLKNIDDVKHLLLLLKGSQSVCFALKSPKELLIIFTHLITLCKDVTFPLITKVKSNRSLNYIFLNRIPN